MAAEGEKASASRGAADRGGPRDAPSRDTVARHLVIEGRVQGVFYRYSMRQVALALGVSGWVHNRYDGGVEAFVQGEQERVEQLIAWCREGPRDAHVEGVTVDEATCEPGLTGFGIR